MRRVSENDQNHKHTRVALHHVERTVGQVLLQPPLDRAKLGDAPVVHELSSLSFAQVQGRRQKVSHYAL